MKSTGSFGPQSPGVGGERPQLPQLVTSPDSIWGREGRGFYRKDLKDLEPSLSLPILKMGALADREGPRLQALLPGLLSRS